MKVLEHLVNWLGKLVTVPVMLVDMLILVIVVVVVWVSLVIVVVVVSIVVSVVSIVAVVVLLLLLLLLLLLFTTLSFFSCIDSGLRFSHRDGGGWRLRGSRSWRFRGSRGWRLRRGRRWWFGHDRVLLLLVTLAPCEVIVNVVTVVITSVGCDGVSGRLLLGEGSRCKEEQWRNLHIE